MSCICYPLDVILFKEYLLFAIEMRRGHRQPEHCLSSQVCAWLLFTDSELSHVQTFGIMSASYSLLLCMLSRLREKEDSAFLTSEVFFKMELFCFSDTLTQQIYFFDNKNK